MFEKRKIQTWLDESKCLNINRKLLQLLFVFIIS